VKVYYINNSYIYLYITTKQNNISDNSNSINSTKTETLSNASIINVDNNNIIKTVLTENNSTDIEETRSMIGINFKLKIFYNLYNRNYYIYNQTLNCVF